MKSGLFILVFLLCGFSFGQIRSDLYPQLSIYKVPIQSNLLTKLSVKYDVLRVTESEADILVPTKEKLAFLKLAPQAILHEQDISNTPRQKFQKSRALEQEAPRYHNYAEVEQILKKAASEFPEISDLVTYGNSAQGLPLMALRVSKGIKENLVAKPRVLLTAATHGDEIITTEVLLALMQTLLQQTSTNPRFQQMIQNTEIVFIPVVNADGFTRQHRYDTGVDPNRSYPYPGVPNAKPSPSIAAELAFIEKYPIAGSIDFHAYSAVFLYPWGYTRNRLSEEWLKIFDPLTERMAKTNNYKYGPISEIMYIAKGSSSDYYFWKNQTVAIAVETGDDKSPDPSEFAKYIQEQEESTWLFIESFFKISL